MMDSSNLRQITLIFWLCSLIAYGLSGSYLNDLALENPLFAWNDYMLANLVFDADEWRQSIAPTNLHEEINMFVADQLAD